MAIILRSNIKAILAICTSLMMTIIVQAQPDINYKKYTSNDGLPANVIHKSIQDSYGFIWISTGVGLCKFDGYEFKIYRPIEGDNTSLSCNAINDVFEDSDKNIWLNSYPCGISKFDRTTEKFELFNFDTKATIEISKEITPSTNIINEINKHILIGATKCLIVLDIKTGRFKKINTGLAKNIAFGITNILKDKNNNIWVTVDDNHIYKYDIDCEFFSSYSDESKLSVYNRMLIFNARDGNIWIKNDSAGIFKLDLSTNTTKKLEVKNLHTIRDAFSYGYEDSKGKLWFVSTSGLYLYNPIKSVIHLVSEFDKNFRNPYRDIFEDSQQNLWVSGQNGLLKINTFSSGIKNLSVNSKNKYSLTDESYIFSIGRFSETETYVACENSIDIFNEEYKKIKSIPIISAARQYYPFIHEIKKMMDYFYIMIQVSVK
ncbi:MAG: hypothetical protein IPO92_09060 [Saprospiraceae bacterium]|nr:hypothetical protein [Saprospiraceae bacterium]